MNTANESTDRVTRPRAHLEPREPAFGQFPERP